MPLINVTAPEGVLNKTEQQQFISAVSDAVLRAERADPKDPAALSLTWAYYDERPAGTVYIGGQTSEQPPFVVAVTTPEGGISAANKTLFMEEVGSIVNKAVGEYEGRLNHWINLHEVAEGSWGGAGQVFPLAGIQAAMNIKESGNE